MRIERAGTIVLALAEVAIRIRGGIRVMRHERNDDLEAYREVVKFFREQGIDVTPDPKLLAD